MGGLIIVGLAIIALIIIDIIVREEESRFKYDRLIVYRNEDGSVKKVELTKRNGIIDYGCREDFSKKIEDDDDDDYPWSMFRG